MKRMYCFSGSHCTQRRNLATVRLRYLDELSGMPLSMAHPSPRVPGFCGAGACV